MWEKNIAQRIAIIIGVLLLGIYLITPPKDKLRGGLDIEGGVSMIFEIQEEPGEDDPFLAEQMKRLLQRRVDPRGVYDLKWRTLGRNRIEVQMPLPPEENKQLKQRYAEAHEALLATNIKRSRLEDWLRFAPEERQQRLSEIAAGMTAREPLLLEAASAYDRYAAALQALQAAEQQNAETEEGADATAKSDVADLQIALRDTEEALDDAKDAVLRTNFDDRRFQEVLDMDAGSSRYAQSIAALKQSYPQLEKQIDEAVARYAAWRAKRTYLEGPADLQRLLRGAGVLEFRILAEPSPENPTKYDRYREQLQERGPRPVEGDQYQWFPVDNALAFLNLESPAELQDFDPRRASQFIVDRRDDKWYVLAKTGREHGLLAPRLAGTTWRLKSAYVTRDNAGRPAVGFTLDPLGGSVFGELTGNNIEKQLCIFVDSVAYSSATIQSRISTSGIITGDFGREKVNYLIQTLQAGSLPARLKDTPVSERVIGSSLGHANLQKALTAGIIGVIVVILVMMGYYLLCGAIANVALLMNVVLVLAAMSLIDARFTLPGIAGVILTMGMAVDANVLIFERMREERERGSSLRMIIKNGYDKALSTIIDSNITTLLTCVIIYYVGSEEIKGFGLTLGWGIVASLFTALFVTRTIFILLIKYNLIKDIVMLRLIGVPTIDWYAKRRFFIPLSICLTVIGLLLLWDRGKHDTLDVEFLGGVSAEAALKPDAVGKYNDLTIREKLRAVGAEISERGRKLADARVEPLASDPSAFRVEAPGIDSALLAAMIREPLEALDLLQRDGVDTDVSGDAVVIRVTETATPDKLLARIRELASGSSAYSLPLLGSDIARANVGAVAALGEESERGRYWNITTTATNKALVQLALVQAFGVDLDVQPRISYEFRGQNDLPYPITNRKLEAVVPGLPAGVGGDVTDYLGGAAIYFDQLNPPLTVSDVTARLRGMRLQPDYQDLPWRDFNVFPVTTVSSDPAAEPLCTGVIIAVGDTNIMYEVDRESWTTQLAQKELSLATAAFDKEQSLRRVTQFKPQIAAQSTQRASMALILSWGMIIGYLWIRFGRPMYGIAGVAALIHDVLIALAFVGISGWIGGSGHPIGQALLIEDFKIDMTIVAAFLTIIGYSINDTIVVFDRIRETRGRLGVVTPQIINQSINQTLARTIMTAFTTFVVLLAMYIFGGPSIRGFNYCMIIGIITGTYSSIAVASPLLLLQARKAKAQSTGG